jgi:hypothetical protein
MARWHRLGAALAVGILAAQLASAIATTTHFSTRDRPPGIRRQELLRDLERQPGRHLLLVRYTDSPQRIFEWVYNDADIDAQRVIVARSIDPASDQKLIHRYADRDVWLLTVDGDRIDGPVAMPR